ncbi:MAG: DUF5668 domain-containing protein [Patescibacteria group bacterium]|nr:DUF5668 domain-containing protein [Patescibacteria group bacterium]
MEKNKRFQYLKKILLLSFDFFVLDSLSTFLKKMKAWFGTILTLIGVVLLLQNTGVLQPGVWRIFWPIVFIAIGSFFIFRARKWKKSKILEFWSRNEKRDGKAER